MENNKLIAEFMGAELYAPIDYDMYGCHSMGDTFAHIDSEDQTAKHFYTPEEMEFGSSWNWLIPVISLLKSKGKMFEDLDSGLHEDAVHSIEDSIWENDISKAYEEVVQFIEWYNQNEKEL